MTKLNVRRSIIREWMSLSPKKRETEQQALGYAKAAVERHILPRSRRPPQDIVMAWLRPRAGRP